MSAEQDGVDPQWEVRWPDDEDVCWGAVALACDGDINWSHRQLVLVRRIA